jgi:exodeoxyribonuclease V beta subunit
LGSAEQDANRLLAKQEELAENLRLFYVAVTRAKYRCYIVWGAFNDADTAPPAHLWHDGASISTLNDADIRADLDNLATNAAGAIRISQPAFQQGLYQAPRDTAVSLFARQPRRYLVSPWQITSFSGLLANQSRQENDMSWQQALELPEQDAFSDKSAAGKKHDADSNERTIWTFPAGARSGEFFHAVLEHLDFTAPQNHLSAQLLRRFGFEDEWQDSVDDALFNILHAQLPGANCCLADIPNSARLNELGFFYPIDNLNAKHLAQTLAPAYGGETPKFEFGTIQGMMRGFIDLVFVHDNKYYVVDYKSNYLGDSYEHYHAKALMGEMRKHHYILQYHIYTLALHHYLQNRLPDYDPDLHLGGVFYLFLRGMHPEHQSGIFFAPPTGI